MMWKGVAGSECDGLIGDLLATVLPDQFSTLDPRDQASVLDDALPYLEASGTDELTISILCHHRPGAFKFFFEMVTQWLAPGQRLNATLFWALDITFPEVDERLYTAAQVVLSLSDLAQRELVHSNLPLIKSEVCLGIESAFYGDRILESRGLSTGDKIAKVQEEVVAVAKRHPQHVSREVVSEMQHFMVTCGERFKIVRSPRQMSRIICIQHFFRRRLATQLVAGPNRHYVKVKLQRSTLTFPDETRPVLSLFVGLTLLGDNERFDRRHLVKVVNDHFRGLQPVEGSFHVTHAGSIQLMYLEVEKEEGGRFTLDETRLLEDKLTKYVVGRIEKKVHAVFFPRNDEDIMRHMLTLASQLKLVRDLPQVIVNFREQASDEIAFIVVAARIDKGGLQTVEELFDRIETRCRVVVDQKRSMGLVRKRYSKEAVVFRLFVPKELFLRGDLSLDLYRARQWAVAELHRAMGEFRDYNGGMIAKQNEVYIRLRELLGALPEREELLLDQFFHSLTPVVLRSVLEPELLQQFFQFVCGTIDELSPDEPSGMTIACTKGSDLRALKRRVAQWGIPPVQLAHVELVVAGQAVLGLLYTGDDQQQRERIKQLGNAHG